MERTWKPTTAGILNIIAGAISALSVIGIVIGITTINTRAFIADIVPTADLHFISSMISTVLILILILAISHTIFPILGGVFALQRKRWGWALTGSIIAILAVFPLGLAATILLAMAKDEFE